MPYLEIKTTKQLSGEKKEKLANELVNVFREVSSKEVAANIQVAILDNVWIQFRGNLKGPSAHVLLCPGPLTPKEDYKRIIETFFPVLAEEMETPQNRIYMNILEFEHWGYDGEKVIPVIPQKI